MSDEHARAVVRDVEAILGAQLVGVHLRGSLAFGSFDPARSEVDLLVVVRAELTDDRRWRSSARSRLAPETRGAPGRARAAARRASARREPCLPDEVEALVRRVR